MNSREARDPMNSREARDPLQGDSRPVVTDAEAFGNPDSEPICHGSGESSPSSAALPSAGGYRPGEVGAVALGPALRGPGLAEVKPRNLRRARHGWTGPPSTSSAARRAQEGRCNFMGCDLHPRLLTLTHAV